MKLIFPAILENISTRSDGSIKISLASQEMQSDKAGDLFQLRNKYVKVLLSDSNITDVQAELVDAEKLSEGSKGKSPSARLRAVLFRLHEQEKTTMSFDDWYKLKIEAIIDQIKSRLE